MQSDTCNLHSHFFIDVSQEDYQKLFVKFKLIFFSSYFWTCYRQYQMFLVSIPPLALF